MPPTAPPLSPSGSPAVLGWAVLGSVLLHGLLLAWAKAPHSAAERVLQDAPLEVVLVNARSQHAPERPQALAQAPLAGGGHRDGTQLATAPTPSAARAQAGDRLDALQQQLRTLEQQRQALLSALQHEQATLEQQAGRHNAHDAQHQSLQAHRRLLAEQLARIERELREQQGPRRRHIGPATQEVAYALYYDRLRQRIETEGTRHFPQADGVKLYGELVMAITLDQQGRVLAAEVARGSGQPRLDAQALAIVRGAAPFEAFSPAMRQQAEQIVVVSGFRFARDLSLHTRLLATPEGRP